MLTQHHGRYPGAPTYRLDVLPSRAPLPRPRTMHDRTLVVRRAHPRTAWWALQPHRAPVGMLRTLLVSDEAFASGLLLAWGLVGMLAHLWLAPMIPLA